MAIRGAVGIPTKDIDTSDTVLLQPVAPLTRRLVTHCSLSNTTGGTIVVSLYESPNLTSASGKLVATVTLTATTSDQVVEIIGVSYLVGLNLIATADVVGSNATITVTDYDGIS